MPVPIWFVGGDARSVHAAEFLRRKGVQVHAHAVAGLPDELPEETIDTLVLPFPSLRGGMLRSDVPIPIASLLKRLRSGARIFGGGLSALPDGDYRIIDLLGSEPLSTRNAVPTAEGALLLALQSRAKILCGAHCLVLGFGRCGKVLAQRLRALDAEVTVAARKPSDLALLRALGFDATPTSRVCCSGAECVFNTIPCPIFDAPCFTGFQGQYFELASAPGGLTPAAKEALGAHYTDAGALPARFFPATAGELYGAAIWEKIKEES